MASIFDVLPKVESRPLMYLGGYDSHGELLRNLEMFLVGYATAIQNHAIEEPVTDFSSAFAGYLYDRFGWSVECGPIAAIRDAAASDSEAWAMFFRLSMEFRNTLG